jgi:hypothetical protein
MITAYDWETDLALEEIERSKEVIVYEDISKYINYILFGFSSSIDLLIISIHIG